MTDINIGQEILRELAQLPTDQQQEVLEYVRALSARRPRGVEGKSLLKFTGTVPQDDLSLMRQAIAEACEHVDGDEW
jgi:hypothetical protein